MSSDSFCNAILFYIMHIKPAFSCSMQHLSVTSHIYCFYIYIYSQYILLSHCYYPSKTLSSQNIGLLVVPRIVKRKGWPNISSDGPPLWNLLKVSSCLTRVFPRHCCLLRRSGSGFVQLTILTVTDDINKGDLMWIQTTIFQPSKTKSTQQRRKCSKRQTEVCPVVIMSSRMIGWGDSLKNLDCFWGYSILFTVQRGRITVATDLKSHE